MKNIIFDLGGVIIKDKPSSILKKYNIDGLEYKKLLLFFDNWKLLDLGYKSLKDKLLECNFDNSLNKFQDILLNYYKYREIDNNLIELIKELKSRNYKVYVLSDNNLEVSKYYQNHKLFSNIDGWVFSCDYHYLKKDGLLFEIFLNKYHLKPEDCYFIDNDKANIDIARQYNITSYLYHNDFNDLYNNLIKNNILKGEKYD